jgi:uncharacterized protein with GYD domain
VPKYLIKATYTAEGVKGLLKEGGTARRKAVEDSAKSGGGKLESFYFALGETDVYAIVEMASNADAAAISLNVGATGTVHTHTVALLSPAELDKAAKIKVSFRPAGKAKR